MRYFTSPEVASNVAVNLTKEEKPQQTMQCMAQQSRASLFHADPKCTHTKPKIKIKNKNPSPVTGKEIPQLRLMELFHCSMSHKRPGKAINLGLSKVGVGFSEETIGYTRESNQKGAAQIDLFCNLHG